MTIYRSCLCIVMCCVLAIALGAGTAEARKKKRQSDRAKVSRSAKKPVVAVPAGQPAAAMPGVTTAPAPDAAETGTKPSESAGDSLAKPAIEPAVDSATGTDGTASSAEVETKPPPPRIDAAGNVFKPTGDAAVDAAYEACEKLFAGRTLDFDYLPPIRKGSCGTDRPVQVRSFGTQKVKFNPPPTMNCQLLAKLDDWFKSSVQPLARKHLKSPVTRIDNASSYDCRTRYGDPKEKLSEHARANALDMAGFITLNGQRISVAFDWGPNLRDLLAMAKAAKEAREKAEAEVMAKLAAAEAKAKAEADAKAAAAANSEGEATSDPATTGTTSAAATDAAEQAGVKAGAINKTDPKSKAEQTTDAKRDLEAQKARTAAAAEALKAKKRMAKTPKWLAKIESDAAKALVDKKLLGKRVLGQLPLDGQTRTVIVDAVLQTKQAMREERSKTPHKRGTSRTQQLVNEAKELGVKVPPPATSRARFLHEIHKSACKLFGTVLGPEANAAHADHFHVDLTPRNGSSYCQ